MGRSNPSGLLSVLTGPKRVKKSIPDMFGTLAWFLLFLTGRVTVAASDYTCVASVAVLGMGVRVLVIGGAHGLFIMPRLYMDNLAEESPRLPG